MKGKIFFGVGVGILVFVLGISLLSAQTSEWLDGWQYRVPITIRENSGNLLENYQVLIEINTEELISQGKMRSDCGDIRFALGNGTLLNYWIEDGCDSNETKIWVKIPEIPASGTKEIYMYYGNSLAESESNGDAVFEFFDDFNRADINMTKWLVTITGSASYSLADGVLTLSGGSAQGDIIKVKSQTTFDRPIIERVKVRMSNPMNWGLFDSSDSIRNWYRTSDGKWYMGVTVAGTSYLVAIGSFEEQYFHVGEIVWAVDGTELYCDGALKASQANTPSVPLSIRFTAWYYSTTGPSGSVEVDWILVRKYTSPEPTYTLGEEETPTTTTTTTIPTAISWWNDSFQYRRQIDCSNMDDKIPLVINGSGGFDLGCGEQIVWTYCSGTGTALYYNNCSDYVVANDTTQLPMEVEQGSGVSYRPTEVWENHRFVYHLSDGLTTSNILDSSGNQNGTAHSLSSTNSVSGRTANAIDFIPPDDYIDTSQNPSLSDGFSIMLWASVDDLSKSNGLISNHDSDWSIGGCLINIQGDPDKVYFQCLGATQGLGAVSTTTVNAGEWYFITAVYDGSIGKLYVNGKLEGEDTDVGTIQNPHNWQLASFYVNEYYDRRLDGRLDEVRFYDGVLTASEINQTYENMMSTPGYGNLLAMEETPTTTTTTSTTTTTTTTTTTISTTTTTTLPQECGEIGSSCALCDDWVELNTTKGILKVRDSDGNGKFDQVCCSGVVSEVIML